MITDRLRSWLPSLRPLQLLKNKQKTSRLSLQNSRNRKMEKMVETIYSSRTLLLPCLRCSLHARRKKKTESSFYFQPDPCSLVLEKTVFRKHVPQYPLCKSLPKPLI